MKEKLAGNMQIDHSDKLRKLKFLKCSRTTMRKEFHPPLAFLLPPSPIFGIQLSLKPLSLRFPSPSLTGQNAVLALLTPITTLNDVILCANVYTRLHVSMRTNQQR